MANAECLRIGRRGIHLASSSDAARDQAIRRYSNVSHLAMQGPLDLSRSVNDSSEASAMSHSACSGSILRSDVEGAQGTESGDLLIDWATVT